MSLWKKVLEKVKKLLHLDNKSTLEKKLISYNLMKEKLFQSIDEQTRKATALAEKARQAHAVNQEERVNLLLSEYSQVKESLGNLRFRLNEILDVIKNLQKALNVASTYTEMQQIKDMIANMDEITRMYEDVQILRQDKQETTDRLDAMMDISADSIVYGDMKQIRSEVLGSESVVSDSVPGNDSGMDEIADSELLKEKRKTDPLKNVESDRD